MNETVKTIMERRSIRSYTKEQIRDEELNTIIEAGRFAPSAMNQQSWHITVIQKKEVIDKISAALKSAYAKSGNPKFVERAASANFNICYNAPTYIIVSGKQGNIAPQIDCALAMENMFLAAKSLGIGSCWINAVNFLFTTEEGKALKKELGIPEDHFPYCSAGFGYNAAGSPDPAPRTENNVTIIK